MANKNMKRCLTLLAIRKMQITPRYNLIATKMTIEEKQKGRKRRREGKGGRRERNSSCQGGCGDSEPLTVAGGNAKSSSCYGEWLVTPQ